MKLSEEEIREFAALWKQEFKEGLSLDEARIEAGRLLELYGALAEPINKTPTNPP